MAKPSFRAAVIAGAIVGSAALPAIPALAQTIQVPGFGAVEIPDVPQPIKDQITSPQAQDLLNQVPQPYQDQARDVVGQIAPAPSASRGLRALQAAESQIGTPYVWGGSQPGGFDCSGLVQWSYGQEGVDMPRTSEQQENVGTPVALEDAQPGDVVIYNGGSHTALYAGNGQVVHAPSSGQDVTYAPVDQMPIDSIRRPVEA
ncbi:C40 family peptidase [Nocardia sp. XZ_19_385]|uniref:C40 family peptidase n=1 Tax=Nocardia sp. XZ_19_385 TaxID=2769488 RepID=UPI001890A447|nr:NlpC/P60 family protein [Nocardia sp. XZ_19_385]